MVLRGLRALGVETEGSFGSGVLRVLGIVRVFGLFRDMRE